MISIKSKMIRFFGALLFLLLLIAGYATYQIHEIDQTNDEIQRTNAKAAKTIQSMIHLLNELQHLQIQFLFLSTRESDIRQHFANQSRTLRSRFWQDFSVAEHNIRTAEDRQLIEQLRIVFRNYGARTDSLLMTPNVDASTAYHRSQEYFQASKTLLTSLYESDNLFVKSTFLTSQYTFKRLLLIFGSVCVLGILLSIVFSVHVRRLLIYPFTELTHKINAFSERNYDMLASEKMPLEFHPLMSAFNEMAERLKKYENTTLSKLSSEKHRLEGLINHLNDVIVLLDQDKRILSMNRLAEKLFQIPKKQLVGEYISDVAIHNNIMLETIRRLIPAKDQPKSQLPMTISIENAQQTISFLPELISIYPENANSDAPKLIGYLIFLKDITEIQESNNEKKRFISYLSHEIKTPVSSINISTKLLNDARFGNLTNEQVELVETIEKQSQRLLNLANEISTFESKFKSN